MLISLNKEEENEYYKMTKRTKINKAHTHTRNCGRCASDHFEIQNKHKFK